MIRLQTTRPRPRPLRTTPKSQNIPRTSPHHHRPSYSRLHHQHRRRHRPPSEKDPITSCATSSEVIHNRFLPSNLVQTANYLHLVVCHVYLGFQPDIVHVMNVSLNKAFFFHRRRNGGQNLVPGDRRIHQESRWPYRGVVRYRLVF